METWMTVKEFPSYEVSSYGAIRNAAGKPRKPSLKANGYLQVTLKHKGSYKNYYVHRLVACAFMPPSDLSMDVNHKDGVRHNNKLDNLEWASRKENIQHAIKTFGSMCGLKHSQAKLTIDEVEEIRKSDGSSTLAANKYKVSSAHIRAIRNGKRWTNEIARVG